MMQTGKLAGLFAKSHHIRSGRRDVIAAVDLGSNSFHMVVAKVMNGQLHVIDHLREMVQLGAGLNRRNVLAVSAQRRAIACLARFGERLGDLPRSSIRAVGTNTLRKAVNAKKFLIEAEAALGHHIEIISGQEEARLIYAGVVHSVADEPGRRLVLDIGGGSTEFIIGERFEPVRMESLSMGCVSMSRLYFSSGAISAKRMKKAETAARLELRNIETDFRKVGWKTCIGASGTINAIQAVVRANDWADRNITRSSLNKLRQALIASKHVKRLALPGLRTDRAPVFPGGVAILTAAFDSLGIEDLSAADGALREGVLYDLLGRMRRRDIRHHTVNWLCMKYNIDGNHAARVEHTALHCLKQAAANWRLGGEEYVRILSWAARLHEIGLTLTHNQHHKHGAYMIEHGDMPGFSRQDQELLAALIRGHRRKFSVGAFRDFPDGPAVRRLCLLLRLAVLLHRSRNREKIPLFSMRVMEKTMRIRFPRGWLEKHPLTLADLKQEAEYIEEAGVRLIIEH